MNQETLTMSHKETTRLIMMERVMDGSITLTDAAERMGISLRQAIRIKQRFARWGAGGLVHRSRGRLSNRRLPEPLRREALALYREHYADFGPLLAAEKMAQRDGLQVHPETLRRWLIGACLWSGRSRWRRHRRRRTRRERFGEMVQIDGSDHEWFEQRGPRACLMVMVDDATGRIMLHMAAAETTRDALVVLRKWVGRYGAPAALYADRKSLYFSLQALHNPAKRNDPWALSDFAQVAHRLGIAMIPAGSPQAKGRVERKNGLLQDRLVKELRLRAISTVEQANAMLDEFADQMDQRFAVAPVHPADAHRVVPADPERLDELFGVDRRRCVARDHTFSLEGVCWQIVAQPDAPAPGSRVIVRRALDGRIGCLFNGRPLRIEPVGPSPARWAQQEAAPGGFAPLATPG